MGTSLDQNRADVSPFLKIAINDLEKHVDVTLNVNGKTSGRYILSSLPHCEYFAHWAEEA